METNNEINKKQKNLKDKKNKIKKNILKKFYENGNMIEDSQLLRNIHKLLNENIETEEIEENTRSVNIRHPIKKNILEKIKNKINRDIKSYKKYATNQFRQNPSKNNFCNNNIIFNELNSLSFNSYNNKYTRKIVTNYVSSIHKSEILNQIYYNYILGGTINICIKLLNTNKTEIDRLFNEINNRVLKNIFENLNTYNNFNNVSLPICIKNEFPYLSYIFFYLIPRSRRIIEFIKNKDNIYIPWYGKISTFVRNSNVTTYHPFNMKRFINYNRLDIILNNIMNNRIKNVQNLTHMYSYQIENNGLFSELDYCILSNLKFNQENIEKICPINNLIKRKISFKKYTINLDIPDDFFYNTNLLDIYNELKKKTFMFITFFTYDNEPKRLEYIVKNNKNYNKDISLLKNAYGDGYSAFSQYLGSFNEISYNNNRYRILIILSYCLSLLKSRDNRNNIFPTIENDIDKIKKIIIIFYYLLNYSASFLLGTASIAEISLFTLWDTYINIDGNEPLILNQNTMIDVEALSLPFSEFYNNCFNQEIDRNKYTPYFINKEKNILNLHYFNSKKCESCENNSCINNTCMKSCAIM